MPDMAVSVLDLTPHPGPREAVHQSVRGWLGAAGAGAFHARVVRFVDVEV